MADQSKMDERWLRRYRDLWRGFQAVIIAPQELEKVAVEVRIGDDEFANIIDEQSYREVIIYPRIDGQPWQLPLEDLITYLQHANHVLTARVSDESCIVCSQVIDPPR